MANRILIEYGIGKEVIDVPLLDDVLLDARSQFSSFADMVPKVADILKLVTTGQAAITGGAGEGMMVLTNMFDIPKWQKTEPLRFTTKLGFYTKTNAKADVWDKMRDLVGLSILTYDRINKSYKVPGISLSALKEFKAAGRLTMGTLKDSKLISIHIPKILYLNRAMLTVARPTYSKHQTTKGYPLWGSLDIEVQSIFPANTEMWEDVEKTIEIEKEVKVQEKEIENKLAEKAYDEGTKQIRALGGAI